MTRYCRAWEWAGSPSSPEVAQGLDGGREPRGLSLCLVSKHWSRVSGLSLRSLSASERPGGPREFPQAALEEARPGGLGPRQA